MFIWKSSFGKVLRRSGAIALVLVGFTAPAAANDILLGNWCVVYSMPDGDDHLLVVEKTGIVMTLFCDGGTILGRVGEMMEPGDCATFHTEFVAPDSDLALMGWYPLLAVELVADTSTDGGDGGDGGDGDGDPTGDTGGDGGGEESDPPPPDNNGRT